MPDEVNIDDLIDLPNDEERVQKLQVTKWVVLLISFLRMFALADVFFLLL